MDYINHGNWPIVKSDFFRQANKIIFFRLKRRVFWGHGDILKERRLKVKLLGKERIKIIL
ncbi:hypothetical protein COS54_02235 [Candidatus Shapirobacteria bacterium CG03_land_8_20_14_0_80_39_12]|uniref:Uncharacterized protein n=1 Tax=Candidatus Shapirobacteria bacterium CG03_land_8_20_14_0_80_39_12 TaxID=1974879 RepID=A0A2M7BCS8_9BACT|nr:MAG: hypothetical protein COS54_02235 [Candidatus Shapirobacteria bacterium CG03_land_8_20_14_0_80_39_12]